MVTRSRFELLHVNFVNLQQSFVPLLFSEFCFCSIFCEQIDQIWSKLGYADLGRDCCASVFIRPFEKRDVLCYVVWRYNRLMADQILLSIDLNQI